MFVIVNPGEAGEGGQAISGQVDKSAPRLKSDRRGYGESGRRMSRGSDQKRLFSEKGWKLPLDSPLYGRARPTITFVVQTRKLAVARLSKLRRAVFLQPSSCPIAPAA